MIDGHACEIGEVTTSSVRIACNNGRLVGKPIAPQATGHGSCRSHVQAVTVPRREALQCAAHTARFNEDHFLARGQTMCRRETRDVDDPSPERLRTSGVRLALVELVNTGWVKPNSEPLADRARSAGAIDDDLGCDPAAFAGGVVGDRRQDAVTALGQLLHLPTMSEGGVAKARRQFVQRRRQALLIALRGLLRTFPGVAGRAGVGVRHPFEMRDLLSLEARAVAETTGRVAVRRQLAYRIGDTPPAEDLHGTPVESGCAGMIEKPVTIVDEKTSHAAPTEVASKCKSRRPTSDDEDRRLDCRPRFAVKRRRVADHAQARYSSCKRPRRRSTSRSETMNIRVRAGFARCVTH